MNKEIEKWDARLAFQSLWEAHSEFSFTHGHWLSAIRVSEEIAAVIRQNAIHTERCDTERLGEGGQKEG